MRTFSAIAALGLILAACTNVPTTPAASPQDGLVGSWVGWFYDPYPASYMKRLTIEPDGRYTFTLYADATCGTETLSTSGRWRLEGRRLSLDHGLLGGEPLEVGLAAANPKTLVLDLAPSRGSVFEFIRQVGACRSEASVEAVKLMIGAMDAGDQGTQMRLSDEIIAESPGFGPAYVARAIGARFEGRYDDALADLARANALQPGNPYTLFQAAVTRQMAGDLDGAMRDISEAISIYPDEPDFIALRDAIAAAP